MNYNLIAQQISGWVLAIAGLSVSIAIIIRYKKDFKEFFKWRTIKEIIHYKK